MIVKVALLSCLENLNLPEYHSYEFVSELQLKGKLEKVKIFGLKGIVED